MATITEEHIELRRFDPKVPERAPEPLLEQLPDDSPPDAAYSTTAIPDGGYGWTIVFCCSLITFCHNGIINCWGVLQAALLNSELQHVPPSTLSFVGSLGLAGAAAYGLIATRALAYCGSRIAALIGILIIGLSLIGSGFCTTNVPGLFGTAGVLAGVGMALVYTVSNALPVQYFSGHLGLANGLVKLGGGIGGCVMAMALESLNRHVGIQWTFIIQGLITLGIGLPAASLLKDRVPYRRNVPFMELEMLRSIPFLAIFLVGVTGTFALYVPPYFLPLFAQSVGLSSSTGAGLVAGFNACNAIGRFIAGPLCDKIGPINMLLITMAVNAATMLAIWPVSDTLGPLVLFATLNGVANGSYFTTFPTVIAGMVGPGRAAVAMSMAITGWTGGYLMGAPIAGYLLQAAGGSRDAGREQGISVYRPAIFYAGGISTLASLFVLLARFKLTKQFRKRV
ncbi:MFS general substrate transporter [Aaosphaeria arxii CBS 175.79]|uniref:MFS general substrate transporter n=1 Tax=Aaosphaeria arxii CBS 175.79 TaxID=1450172 RepID=A0A6A5Y7X3_9PLEO|nr:MFS general substrate transporter [Aaosphaeria arxii CBS 175.79]KAF2020654.1 MFS general substrate transporter [Aaosphaeria arxii CBS 175.79]